VAGEPPLRNGEVAGFFKDGVGVLLDRRPAQGTTPAGPAGSCRLGRRRVVSAWPSQV